MQGKLKCHMIRVFIDDVLTHEETMTFKSIIEFKETRQKWVRQYVKGRPSLSLHRMVDGYGVDLEGEDANNSRQDTHFTTCYFVSKKVRQHREEAKLGGAGAAPLSFIGHPQSSKPRKPQFQSGQPPAKFPRADAPGVTQSPMPGPAGQAVTDSAALNDVQDSLQIDAEFSEQDCTNVARQIVNVSQQAIRAARKSLLQQILQSTEQLGGQSSEEWMESVQNFKNSLRQQLDADQQDLKNQQWKQFIGENLKNLMFAICNN